MKKVFLFVLLLLLTACTSELTAERKEYEEQCKMVYYCQEWLDSPEAKDLQDEAMITNIQEQLSYFGDDLEEIRESITKRSSVLNKYRDLEEEEKIIAIVYELLPDEEENYTVELRYRTLSYISVSIVEHEPLDKVSEYTESHAMEYVQDQIDILYHELNYYFDEEVRVRYEVNVLEDYLDDEIKFNLSLEYTSEGTYLYDSNRSLIQWEHIRGLLYDTLDFNMIIKMDPLQTDPNNPTVPRRRLSGFTIDEIFLATGSKSYEDQAFEVYNQVRDFVDDTEYIYNFFDFQVTVQKNYLVLDVNIEDDGDSQEVSSYEVPLEQYFNRKFLQIIEANHTEKTVYQEKQLFVEFGENNQLVVKLFVSDIAEAYDSLDHIDTQVNKMVSDLKTEFESHGYTVSDVIYSFNLITEIDEEYVIISGKHVISTNPLNEVDWYEHYLENNE